MNLYIFLSLLFVLIILCFPYRNVEKWYKAKTKRHIKEMAYDDIKNIFKDIK